MFSLRLLFIISLIVVTGVIVVNAVSRFSKPGLTESKIIQIIEGDDEWILQCDITNNNDGEIKYIIIINVDGAVRRDSALVQPGQTYTYTNHIYLRQIEEGKIDFTLYEAGNEEPVEKATYYLGGD